MTYAQTKASYQSAGDKAFAIADYSAAISFYLQALEFDEDDAYLMMKIGESNNRLFEYQTALAWLNRCQSKDRLHSYPEALIIKAETLKCLMQYDDAKRAVSTYIAIDSLRLHQAGEKKLLTINIADSISKNKNDSIFLNPLEKQINTAFSEFGASYANDSTLLFSSLRFETPGSKNKTLMSKILTVNIDSQSTGKPKLLDELINNPSWHNCNSSVSPEGKLMVFSRCNYNEDNKLICALYESRLVNNKWQEPLRLSDEINKPGFTSTQPCITTSGIEGYIMYFISDQPGGFGQTDIYRSKRDARGAYTKPENCGKRINTSGNEFSPFYNADTGILYFSSDSLQGLGGEDIFQIAINDVKAGPTNLGLPFNSGYNDLYFTQKITNPSYGLLSSNRPGSLELNGQTCCYDIFFFTPTQKSLPQSETVDVLNSQVNIHPIPVKNNDSNAVLNTMLFSEYLPLKLFFDNDYPDPRSRKSTTKSEYESLYQNYFSKLENYIAEFSLNKSKSADEAREAVELFFANDLQFNYKQLEKFSALLLSTLKAGNNVNISIRGCASPLAESSYNLILSQRRINSLLNYWRNYKSGILMGFISSGKMKITEEAAGETLSTGTISDKRNDLANSVYNPSAARERRIEITNVTVIRQ